MASNWIKSRPGRALRAFVMLSALGVGLAACEARIATHGHRIDLDNLVEVVPGRTDKTQVELLLGSASSTGNFGADIWYYISERNERVAFRKPVLIDRQIVYIAFDSKGVVDQIGKLDEKDGTRVPYVDRETETAGQRITLIQQLIGNIGRFNKTE